MAQLDQASTAGRTALEHAYGDQRLRAAARLAEILHEAGDSDGAVAVIDAELAAFERPAEGTDVRSFRYLTALEELRAALTGQVDAP
jgi:hypothetical protein